MTRHESVMRQAGPEYPVAAVDSGRSGHEKNHFALADIFSCFALRCILQPLACTSKFRSNIVNHNDNCWLQFDTICLTHWFNGTNAIPVSYPDANTQSNPKPDTNPGSVCGDTGSGRNRRGPV